MKSKNQKNFRNVLLNAGAFLSLVILLIASCGEEKPEVFSQAQIIQSSASGDLLKNLGKSQLQAGNRYNTSFIKIDPGLKFQEIVGIGGSFTEATASVLGKLSAGKRTEVLQAYFSPEKAGYSLTRTHINSCDFSLSNYAYTTVENDTFLESFSVSEDEDDLIPLIKDAMAVEGAEFKLVASPWTAPPWMKDNNAWNDGYLKTEFYPTWALYFSKYIHAYKAKGIPVWAVTVENEPMGNGGQWESMIYTPEQMATFIKYNLGPQFEHDELDTKIMIFDQNRDHLEEWATSILNDPEAAGFVWGTAVHWYSSTYDWYPEVLNKVHQMHPDKALLHSEGCIDAEIPVWQDDAWYWKKEATDWGYDWAPEKDKHLHPKYAPVFRYARDIIGGLNSWLCGWIDWNLVLDDKGGPNHANNWCIAPVIARPESNEVYYTPLYYTLSHFSKYIRPGAYRIGLETDIDKLMATAVLNKDNSIVLEVLNQENEQIKFFVEVNEKSIECTIPGSALQTIIIH
ncbi:MAG: glycoside hydrolase family 30 protein [Calditrichae bacterium]|nr:glycoside hydrolase family 30 protein [Calditrichota bacterium]MCB9058320.1 glycoside hydrolase family 30 protein [Calditrichia bacterium]